MKNKISKKTVVIGLSGGVDSAVAALLLKKKGYRIIAAFMKNFSDTKNPITGECNWVEEREMAKRISSILEIPFYTFDFEKEYKSLVIERMFKDYNSGLTPNPDIACNTIIKFPLFWREAKKLGADYIAFGHYARIKKCKDSFQLLKGKDKSKDQSYFLSELSQSDLSHTIFPIGQYKKSEIREIAKKNKFPNWNKSSTKGICFVGKIDIKKFLERKIKTKIGKVFDPERNLIGTHHGTSFYTIGQRIGPHIGIKIVKPHGYEQKKWYVADKTKNNIIIAAPENHAILKRKEVYLKKLHLINNLKPLPRKLKARIRHLGDLHEGTIKIKKNKIVFMFSKPLKELAAGQSLALYKGEELIGSGEIRFK